jgi:hypothetical protein
MRSTVKVGNGTKASAVAAAVATALAACLKRHSVDYCLGRDRTELHHVVLRTHWRARYGRWVLNQVGIGIDAPVNLVKVPYGLHRALHSYAYIDAVNDDVGQAYAAMAGGKAAANARVSSTLRKIALDIVLTA